MSPISREREYARRRYERWQTKQAVKQARQRRQRRVAITSSAAVAAVIVIAGVLFVVVGNRDDATPVAAADPSPTASTSATATSSAGPNPCPAPTVKPAGTPQSFATPPPQSLAEGKLWTFTITTSCGPIVAELDGAKAPKAVANAVFLSGKRFWDGTPCHRLGGAGLYMLQCGDPTGSGTGGPGYSFGPVENAPADGVYRAGTLAMARTAQPDSQGSQFFLVFQDTRLDGGYTVFGRIVQGLDVVTKIAAGGVANPGPQGDGPPARAISIVRTSIAAG